MGDGQWKVSMRKYCRDNKIKYLECSLILREDGKLFFFRFNYVEEFKRKIENWQIENEENIEGSRYINVCLLVTFLFYFN